MGVGLLIMYGAVVITALVLWRILHAHRVGVTVGHALLTPCARHPPTRRRQPATRPLHSQLTRRAWATDVCSSQHVLVRWRRPCIAVHLLLHFSEAAALQGSSVLCLGTERNETSLVETLVPHAELSSRSSPSGVVPTRPALAMTDSKASHGR
jgi:hypothetical protein